jgi:hypothetical protein
LSAGNYLKSHFPEAKWGISQYVVKTQKAFKDIFEISFPDDG